MLFDIKSMNLEELSTTMKQMNMESYRSKQVFEWLHKKTITSFDACNNLPKKLIQELSLLCDLKPMSIVEKYIDKQDKTIKYLLQLHDKHIIEAVAMRYKYGISVCISSQVGCRMGCTFCASTVNGLTRQLTASEFLEQIYIIERDLMEPVHSIVVMGTGEPFDNYAHLIRFVELISSPQGRNISRRNITVSTCGIVDKIQALIVDAPQINLAISLHATTQEERRKIMPISQKYSLDELLEACKDYTQKTHRRITFEYSLIEDVNDSMEEAKRLANLLKGMLCHVNLIPINPVDHKEQKPTKNEHILKFKKILDDHKIQTTLRRSLGQEIDAACGQLKNRYLEDN